jgi:hypothetical protein
VPHESLGDEENTFQIYIQNGIVIRFGNVPEIRVALESGIVHQDVDLTELRGSFGNEPLSIGYFAYVALNRGRFLPIASMPVTTSSAPTLFAR